MKIAACFLKSADGPRRNSLDASSIVQQMVRAQTHLDHHRARLLSIPDVSGDASAGCVSTSDQFSRISMVRENSEGNWLAISGVPIDHDRKLDVKLQRIVEGDHHSAARSLPELDGAFAALFWDNRTRKLVIVTDVLGMQPLYVYRDDRVLLLATEINGIVASGLVKPKMDLAGWGSFIAFGHAIGNRTLVDRVTRFEPACVTVFDPSTHQLEQSTYWHWPKGDSSISIESADGGALVDSLRRDVRGYLEYGLNGVVLLSGGFDSRIIAALLREENPGGESLIVSHPDELFGADSRFAVRVGRALGMKNRLVASPRSFYSSKPYADYLILNEITTTSLYLFISQVYSHLHTGLQAVWEGVAPGQLFRPTRHPPGGFRVYLSHEIPAAHSRSWKAAHQVFGKSTAGTMFEAFQDLLQRETARYPDDGFGVKQFVVRNRMRYRTASNPLQVYSNVVVPFTPGISKAAWSIAGQIPYEAWHGDRLYLKVFREHFPGVAGIPFLSGMTIRPKRSPWGLFADVGKFSNKNRILKSLKAGVRKVTRGSTNYWEDSRLVAHVIENADLEHEDLDKEGVRAIQTAKSIYDRARQPGRRIFFYWQFWRWIMDGRISVSQTKDFSKGT